MKRRSTLFWVIGIVVVLGALFAYPRLASRNGGGGAVGVPCLLPNVPLVQHLHPVLTIAVDGTAEGIPGEVGLNGACERAVHTHSDDAFRGVLHVESQDMRTYVLGDFMSVWQRPLVREGYALTATVDGTLVTDPAGVVLKDGARIRLEYRRN